ncbi:TonB-linked SusC/RagA family outer membrane protein [Pedobacter sp. AK017]|uniref:SusC/RagA family TonB-linked outer membrane protein n=1 Tax=Pedobacter sp. AK017 TaxID=2723073 RepID=UPI0018351B18|nr:SusC/RagA family TonB-linked outer membrane protein [Pedobacter sp. AK017]MBB5438585.1 TonB-linked SusC/RagA family outer membrane protein [Pedobacter sp. AK017]
MILLIAFMQISFAANAQKISLSKKNAPLTEVFRELKKQSGYGFMINREQVKMAKPVTINMNDDELEKVLNKCFEGQPFTYKLEGKMIVVIDRKPGQVKIDTPPLDVTGKIVDENGQPIVGATIKVKGTWISTISDNEGRFSLKNIGDNTLLEISYLGYQIKEVKASKDLGVLKMEVAVGKLDEITVNAGYYSVRQRELTGNISRITSKDIENQPVTNVLASMQGRMAGVAIIQTTGTPGGSFDIKIRGQNSIRAEGNVPLYIIDGVPYAADVIGAFQTGSGTFPVLSSPINSISPDNLESIEVLKDADATAIYGTRGANGVVLITTKKGIAGKAKVNLNVASGIATATRFIEMMNTEEYLAMRKQAYINDDIGNYPASAYDINGIWDQTRYTDWLDELVGGTAKNNFITGSVSGGNKNSRYLISGNYNSESTVAPGNSLFQRGGALANFNHRSEDQKFKADFSLNYNLQKNNQPSLDFINEARGLAPNAPSLYDAQGNLNWENNTWQNPLRNLNGKFESKTKTLIVNTTLSYQLFPGLDIKSTFGITDLRTRDSRVTPSTINNPAFNPSTANSLIVFNNTDRSSWIIEPQINWTKTTAKAKLEVLFGGTYQRQYTSKLYQSGMGFSSNSLIYNLAAAKTIRILNDESVQYNFQGFFGRINYNYKERYIANLTARRDGSSRFGPGRQFANFGALGLAWIFSKENFLKNDSWLSFGKIRGSYGITGSDQIGDYQFLNTYTASGVDYDGKIGINPSRLYNPDFAWETNNKLEAALELGFLDDKIFLTAAWYQNRSSNQLVGVPFPAITGFTTLNSNLDATVQNTGLEWTFTSQNIQSKSFRWATNLNISVSRNKLVRFPGLESSSYSQQYRVGEPLNIRLVYQYKGINPQTGIYEFVDRNGDNIISSPNDRQTVVDLSPRYFGGLQNQFSFKGFKLDFLFQFVKQNNQGYQFTTGGSMLNRPKRMIDSWQKGNESAPYQILTTGVNSKAVSAGSLYASSDAIIVDASYIRLKNLSLSYDLPIIVKGTKSTVSLQGQNLLTFTSFKDGDPEFLTSGFLPPLKVITAGFQLTF